MGLHKNSIKGIQQLYFLLFKRQLTNYPFCPAAYEASLTKETKKVIVRINGVFAFKNGKIVREWDTYDTAPFMELLK